MKIYKFLIAAAIGAFMCTPLNASEDNTKDSPLNEYEMLMSKIRKDFKKAPDLQLVNSSLKLFDDKKGAFKDIDYTRDDRTFWPPLNHLTRLTEWAQAYTAPGNRFYGKKSLFNRIVKGLEYWHEANPECNNWWYNQIAEPQQLGIMLIILREGKLQVPEELESKLLSRVRKDGGHPSKWTGANRTDISLHWIYRSCLSKNEDDLKVAIEQAFSPIYYTTEEGFQYDNSYFQHGVQLYIGGYGDEILKGITQIANYTKGTKYQLDKEKIDILSKFMRETYYRTFRGKYMSFDVLGRGMSRKDILDKSQMALFAQRMIDLDPEHKEEFKQIVDRLQGKQPASYGVRPSHNHYHIGDYTLHVRPGYLFDVRLSSHRTGRCEYGNRENLLTYFLSDGCTNITVDGDEYHNIQSVWDWNRLPGITCPQMKEIPLSESDWQQKGQAIYAGGVSDSIYGASGYAYYDTYKRIDTGVKKSWFFFDNEVVCMGDVTSTSEYDINTTINQCRLKGQPVVACDGNRTFTLEKGQHTYPQLKWVHHNKIGYVFPQTITTGRNGKNAEIWVNNHRQEGNWNTINRSMPDEKVAEDVFSLGFNYAKEPRHASYAYIIIPNMQHADEMNAYLNRNEIQIISNTPAIQSVYHKRLKVWQIIFFEKGSIDFQGMKAKVNGSCAVMIKEMADGHYAVHIANPSQQGKAINLSFSFPGKAEKKVRAYFPTDRKVAGATKAYIL